MKSAIDVPGWMDAKELDVITSIAIKYQPRVVIEIGSFAGRSALAWGAALPESIIYCVDLFDDNFIKDLVPIEGSLLNPDLTADERKRTLYSLFLENTCDYPNIRHLRCDHGRLLDHWHRGIVDLVFIDGHHTFDGVTTDLTTAKALNAKVICGHDYGYPGYGGPEHKGVTTGVDKFRAKHPHRYTFTRHPGTTIFELAA